MEEPKKCPFCGGEAEIIEENIITRFYIECKKCNSMTNLFKTKEEAIAAWNRRVDYE